MSLTREQILSAVDRKTVEVQTPEWGEGASVFVRTLSAAERDEFDGAIRSASQAGTVMKDARARFAVMVISDKDGTRLFDTSDIDALTAKSAIALNRIAEVGMKLNAMREKDVEELEKN